MLPGWHPAASGPQVAAALRETDVKISSAKEAMKLKGIGKKSGVLARAPRRQPCCSCTEELVRRRSACAGRAPFAILTQKACRHRPARQQIDEFLQTGKMTELEEMRANGKATKKEKESKE